MKTENILVAAAGFAVGAMLFKSGKVSGVGASQSKAKVLRDNPQFSRLINAVVNQLGGTESLEDIRNHGIDGGYTGFTYYSDTVPFAMRNRKQIIELLEEQASQLGEDVVNMVNNFGVFRRNGGMDAEERNDLYRYLGGGKPKETTIPNIMAWFAAEEVARMFEKWD